MNKYDSGYPIWIDNIFIQYWLDYFYYSQKPKNNIIILNYNL